MDKVILFQWSVFVVSVIMGMIITFVYDNIRCIRQAFKHNVFWIAIEDMIFWLSSACFVVYIMYTYNHGSFRIYIIIGAFIGMFIYFVTISSVYVKISVYILCFVKKVFVTFIQKVKILLKIMIKKVKINSISSKKLFTMVEGKSIEYEKEHKTQKK